MGLFDAIERELQEGLANNPDNRVEPMRVRGVTALFSGRFSEAAGLLQEVDRLSRVPRSEWYLAQALYYAGERERAETLLEKVSRSSSASGVARAQATLASLLAARGQRGEAQKLLQTTTDGGYMDHHVAYSVGAGCAMPPTPAFPVIPGLRAIRCFSHCAPSRTSNSSWRSCDAQ